MTRTEFDNKVEISYQNFKSTCLAYTPAKIYDIAYQIAKITSIRDYLLSASDSFMSQLYPFADTILNDLDNYEDGYDSPMWCTLEDLCALVSDYLDENIITDKKENN